MTGFMVTLSQQSDGFATDMFQCPCPLPTPQGGRSCSPACWAALRGVRVGPRGEVMPVSQVISSLSLGHRPCDQKAFRYMAGA